MLTVLAFALCYLLGSFPTGVVLSRIRFGIDVREMGSGNIGATNVTRNFGWSAGAWVFLVDFLKGFLPLWLAASFFPMDVDLLSAMAIALVLGHCFSIFLRFHGGKGVATTLGCLLAVSPIAFVIAGALYVSLLTATRISAIGSLGGIFGAAIYILSMEPQVSKKVLVLCLATIVVIRHRSNLERLFRGRKLVWIAITASALVGASAHAGLKNSLFRQDVATALEVAKTQHKPLLLVFEAPWCPPCNELHEMVYSHPSFAKATSDFVRVEIDADAVTSWKWKDRYRIQGYPTIVFADSAGQETLRIVGFRPIDSFLKYVGTARRLKASGSYEKACRSFKPADIERCAFICSERNDKPCARKAYGRLKDKLSPKDPAYHLARAFFTSDSETEDLKRDGYERLLTELPSSPLALGWAVEYQEVAGSKAKSPLIEGVLKAYPEAAKSPMREAFGLTPTDMPQLRAMLLEKIGRPAEAKAAWKEAANELEKLSGPTQTKNRGFALERISCLESAGEVSAALQLAQEFRAKFPDEFTFHFRVAGILFRSKDFAEAMPIARQAFERSYGDNRVRTATLYIQLLETVPDRATAKRVFESTTQEIRPDANLEIRTGRYLQKLKDAYLKWNPAS